MELSNAEISRLKAAGQHLEPEVFLGKQGMTPDFLKSVETAFVHRELIKMKFVAFKKERRELAPQIAEKTGSRVIMIVGHVAVLYRPKPKPAQA